MYEDLIKQCIPGGSICDPQKVADEIRQYSPWRPIESSPTDYWVLLYCGTGGMIEGIFSDGQWVDGFGEYIVCATHWMPLPEPPK